MRARLCESIVSRTKTGGSDGLIGCHESACDLERCRLLAQRCGRSAAGKDEQVILLGMDFGEPLPGLHFVCPQSDH
jgi:hypothetical protein